MAIIESLAGEMHIFRGPRIARAISNLIGIEMGVETLDQISKVPPWLCLISMEMYVFCCFLPLCLSPRLRRHTVREAICRLTQIKCDSLFLIFEATQGGKLPVREFASRSQRDK